MRFDWWEAHFMAYGVLVSALVVAGLLVLDAEVGVVLPRPQATDAGAILGTVASLSGSLLGFALATATIAAGMLEKPSAWRVRSSDQLPTVWSIFISTTKWLGVLTVVSVTMLIVDSSLLTDPLWYSVVLFIALVAMVRIARCIWILEFFMRVQTSGRPTNSVA